MPPPLASLIAKLDQAQGEFLRTADSIGPENWKTRPEAGRWSAAELVAHLIGVEKAVIAKADRISQHEPKPVSFIRKLHLPMALVESRIIRRKSPVPVNSDALREKEVMLAELRDARERSLAFLDETKDRELGEYWWKHPAVGMLNMYGWIEFLAAHQKRHTKQMREIATALQKIVTKSQK